MKARPSLGQKLAGADPDGRTARLLARARARLGGPPRGRQEEKRGRARGLGRWARAQNRSARGGLDAQAAAGGPVLLLLRLVVLYGQERVLVDDLDATCARRARCSAGSVIAVGARAEGAASEPARIPARGPKEGGVGGHRPREAASVGAVVEVELVEVGADPDGDPPPPLQRQPARRRGVWTGTGTIALPRRGSQAS